MRSLCDRKHLSRAAFSFFFIFNFIFLPSPTPAQDDLNLFSPGAVATGIGRSGVVETFDPSALYWNPAAIVVRHHPQGVMSIHEPYHVNYLGYSHFTPTLGTFALSYASTSSAKTAVKFAGIGWGCQFASGFYGGISIAQMQRQDATWGALGVGLLYRPGSSSVHERQTNALRHSSFIVDRLSLGLAIQNLPLGAGEFEHQIRIGASYKLLHNGPSLIYAHHFMPHAGTDHFGLLITPAASVQIYAGIENFDSNTFSFGAGYVWDNIGVHAAYSSLSKRLIFSTNVRIGKSPRAIASNYYDRAVSSVREKNKREAMRLCRYSLIYDENLKKSAELQRLLIPILAREDVTIDSLLHTALSFQNRQLFLNAAAQYLKILKIDPNNKQAREAIAMIRPKVNIDAERWYVQAVNSYEKGDIDRAAEIFESIILVRPDHFGSKNYLKKINDYYLKQAEQHYFAGLGYYSQHKLDQADAEFRTALKIAPNYEDAAAYLSRIAQARKQNSDRIQTLLQQAQQSEAQGEWKIALGVYKNILQIQPDHALALAKAAELKRRLAGYAERYYTRGLSAFNKGNLEQAERMFRTALSMQASHAGARRYLRKIAATTTDKAERFINEAQNFIAQGEWSKAAASADSALAIHPESEAASAIKSTASNMIEAQALMATAQNQYAAGQYLDAMESLDKLLKINKDDPAASKLLKECRQKLYTRVDDYFNRGIELYTEEKYQQAIRMWDIVLRINPYHKGALDYQKKARERMEALESLP